MFKVLVIAYYFPPLGLSGVQRTLKFVKYLKKYNWEPAVLTTGSVGYFAHDNSLLKEAENIGIRIIRTEAYDPNALLSKYGTIKPPSEKIRKFFNRISQTFFVPDNKKSWSKKAFLKAKEILQQESFDAVFITGPPFSSFYYLRKIKKLFDIPVLLDYRDLWYESYFAFYPTPIHKWLHKRMEYLSLKAADKITTTNRRIKEKIIKDHKFITFNDVVILPHGYDPEDFENTKPIPKPNNKMVLTYSGIFMEYNTPKYLLYAFKKLTAERPDIANNIRLHFAGYLRRENQKLILKLDLEEYVVDHGYMNHKEAVQKLISSDVLWMMIEKRRNIDAILPGKLLEYIGSGKPIIGCVPDGAAKSTLEEYGASFITEPDNIDEIKDILIKVYELYKKNELPVPNQEVLQKYRRDFITEQLTKQLQSIVKSEIV